MCACFVAMPHKRLFTSVDPVLELKQYTTATAPSIAREKAPKRPKEGTNGFDLETGVDKERPKSRQRWSRNGSSLDDHDILKRVNFSPQPNAKQVIYQLKTKQKPVAASKELEKTKLTGRAELMDDKTKKRKRATTEALKQTVDLTRSRLEVKKKLVKEGASSRLRSLSAPQDPGKTYSISTIVKARTMAMKWRGKNGRMARRHTVLPTIADDSTKISLCANVKCSPQFETVIKLLEGDEDVDDADKSFQLLNLN